MLDEAQANIQFGPLAPTGQLTPGAPTTLGSSSLPRVYKSQTPTKGSLETERRGKKGDGAGDAGWPWGQPLSCWHGGEEEAVAYEQTSVPRWCPSGGTTQGPALSPQQEARWLDHENILRVETVDVQRLSAPRVASSGPGTQGACLALSEGWVRVEGMAGGEVPHPGQALPLRSAAGASEVPCAPASGLSRGCVDFM